MSEILAAKLTPGEDEKLENEYRRMTNSKKIMEALQLVDQAAGENGASAMIGRGVRELSAVSAYDEQLEGLEEQLAQIEDLLSDFHRELTGYMDSAQFDGERFAQVEERLDEINRLKAKYGSTIEAILTACEEKQARIDQLKHFDTYEKN